MSDFFMGITAASPEAILGTESLLGLYSFWSFVVVAVVTSVLVFTAAQKMKGGLFGKVLNYFGIGMMLILVSLVLANMGGDTLGAYTKVVRDALNTIGYVLMALAANKLYTFTKAQ